MEAVLALATLNKVVVDLIVSPLKQWKPGWDYWWVIYLALFSGAAIGWFSNVNILTAYTPNEILGRLLTSILIGGGSSVIHDFVKKITGNELNFPVG